MTDQLQIEAIKDLHCEVTEVHDFLNNGDEISYKFAVPHCVECRVEWPCMTISVFHD